MDKAAVKAVSCGKH